jgi:hypothetical protein
MRGRSAIDLTGRVCGRWTVISRDHSKPGQMYWLCKCECGTVRIVQGGDLRNGGSKGCKQCREYKGVPTHGMYHTPEYKIWSAMWQRCTCQTSQQYKNYGARGISVCDRWSSFQSFFDDMGPRPPSARGSRIYSIDRINNDGNYEPNNCRWTTITTQRRNTRLNRLVTFNDTTKCVAEWAAQYGMHRQSLLNRLNHGWSIERAITEPVHKHTKSQS